MTAIWKRDVRSFLCSPLGCVYLAAFIGIMNLYFFATCILSQSSDLSAAFSNMLVVLMFLMPLMTMRLFSEEYRQGTDRLLLTSPVGVWEIVLAKFLSAMTVILAALALTLPWLIIVILFGTPAWSSILGTYVALLCASAVFAAIGSFLSSLTESQLIAAVLSFAAFLGIYVLDMLQYSLSNELLTSIFSWLSIYSRYSTFTSGLFSLGDLVYFLTLTALFLFFTVRVVERRRH
ncbi:MAG: ABC transporter permease [Butyricicoccaceae bacterium]